MTKIIKANESHIQIISGFWLEMLDEVFPNNVPDRAAFEKFTLQQMKTNSYACFIAFDSDFPIGFVDGAVCYNPTISENVAYGQNFYLDEQYRKTGVGARMLLKLINASKPFKPTQIQIIAYPESMKFWKDSGFKQDTFLLTKYLKGGD